MFLLNKSSRIIQNGLRQYNKIAKPKTNPGLNKRRKLFADQLDAQEEPEDMDLDNLETDFMNVHQTYKEHKDETENIQERIKYMIVQKKYFKEKYPNFLTWHDKEQIKYLHSTDPKEWTVEKLSESFPALPEIVIKIIKSKFTKKETKIPNHDASVQKNWESFKRGKMPDLPRNLIEHLNKFTNRALNLKPFSITTKKKEITIRPNVPSDFSEIITSYEKLRNKSKEDSNAVETSLSKQDDFPKSIEMNLRHFVEPHTGEHQDTYLTVPKSQIKDKRNITLTQLQTNIENRALHGKTLTEDEKIIFKDSQRPKEPGVVSLNQEDTVATKNKYQTSSGSALAKKTERDYSHLTYPEKITIPKKQLKQGYTYRLNDCYYDFDGEFLYRVPGMG
ncbi:hypothetical protein JTB14_015143 [Gonioctena quinquepunctata]|nr:hypothetical protein JTB14_015143 [Gonioctena quinquepunctata]